MSNATGGTFRAVVSDTDFSVAVGIFVAIAVVSFLPLIAVIIRLAVSKAVQPMSKSMSASERLAHSRRAAKRSTLAVRGVGAPVVWEASHEAEVPPGSDGWARLVERINSTLQLLAGLDHVDEFRQQLFFCFWGWCFRRGPCLLRCIWLRSVRLHLPEKGLAEIGEG